MTIPKFADIVIIGGGVMGASTAYHLAAHGQKDILLIEKDMITSIPIMIKPNMAIKLAHLEASSKYFFAFSLSCIVRVYS